MKNNLFFIAILPFLLCTIFFFASQQATGREAEAQELNESTPDSQRALMDQQSTRVMQLEDELHALERDLSRKFSELEEQLSRDQSLFREYLDIHRRDIQEIETGLAEHASSIKQVQEGLDETEGALEEMRQVKGTLQQAVQNIEASHQEVDSRLEELSRQLSGIDAEYSKQLERIQGLGELQQSMADYEKDLQQMESGIKAELESQLERISKEMQQELTSHQETVDRIEAELGDKIAELSREIEFTDQGLADRLQETDAGLKQLEAGMEERTMYTAAAAALALLLGVTGLAGMIGARRGRRKLQKMMEETSRELRDQFQEQQALQDSKLVELLENLSLVMPEPGQQQAREQGEPVWQEKDHSLALSLADELYKLVKRSRKLPAEDENTRDIKASLSRSYKALKEKGYEIVDLEGMQYRENMEARVEFVLTHELLPGEQVVSNVLKPLVKYRGSTIQQADIQVQAGE
ncbi:hypothetical protein [Desulfonatronospira sp.]|uniref:hypothetical protein n=1 Tax=Desulfonatronospira sp. TaxID=1962951 RepID=UPI0025BAE016|nr:hypothetical protein [Desulfonatronospira sp.]